jgi:hypothetical protein
MVSFILETNLIHRLQFLDLVSFFEFHYLFHTLNGLLFENNF